MNMSRSFNPFALQKWYLWKCNFERLTVSIHHEIMLWNIGSKAFGPLFLRRYSAEIVFSIRHRSWTRRFVSNPVSRYPCRVPRLRAFDGFQDDDCTACGDSFRKSVRFLSDSKVGAISQVMETFIIIGMCFLCYELCEFLYHCSPKLKDTFKEEKRMVFTVSESVQAGRSAPSEIA